MAVLGLAPPAARAGFISDVAYGLGYIGFDIRGQQMPLNGGFDLLVTRNFVGNPLDFGPWDVTLQGPLSLSVNVGGHALRELEVSLNTAVNQHLTPTPLNYVLNVDAGGQSTQVAGNLLIDADLKLNNFGFYEINLTYSSRQTVIRDGRFANDEIPHDFDLGPIVVSGNIVADILAILTEPIFAAAGRPNPFANFSATSKINEAIDLGLSELRQQLADGVLASEYELPATDFIRVLDLVGLNPAPTTPAATVPEPPVLLLMLAALPLLLNRKYIKRLE